MQASAKHGAFEKHQKSLYQNSMPSGYDDSQFRPQDHRSAHSFSSEDRSQPKTTQSQINHVQFCTLESSLSNTNYVRHHSPSFDCTTSSGSPLSQQDSQSDNIYGSPISASCITEDPKDLRNRLKEIEAAMLGPDSDMAETFEDTCLGHLSLEPEKWKQVMGIPRGDLKQLLIACARAVAENDLIAVEWLISDLKHMVSVSGEPMQRLGAYLLEGLIARLASSGSSIYKSLKCKEPISSDLLSYMRLLYEVCPYFKFGYLSANGAIADAVKDEDMIHIIDFQIAQGSQWVTLIQAFAARPGGPPCVRITGVDDSNSAYARGGGLHLVGQRLSQLAESCKVPFEFHGAAISGYDVEPELISIRPGEAVAVNFPFQLHHMPDESVSTRNHRDRLIRMVKSFSPKIVTLVEQESNTNTAPFFPRFLETLDYYTAMFESVDVTVARDSKERINVEQHCIARDIVNIIACEGEERVERHELYGKWRSRFMMAGFRPCPLSPMVNATIKTLLQNYSEHYWLEERDGVLYLGWKNRTLVVSWAFSTGIRCRGAAAAAVAAAAASTFAALLRMFSRMSPGGISSPPARLPLAVAAEAEKTLNPHLQHQQQHYQHQHLCLSNTSQFLPNSKLFQISAPRITVGVSGRSLSGSVSNISSEPADGPTPPLMVVSFYKFADFPDFATHRKPLKELCEDVRVSGGIILAPEGINGSICGTPESVEKVLNFIQADERLRGLRLVESPVSPEDEVIHHGHTSHSPLGAGEDAPFRWDHVRVKLKKEIVTFGDPRIRPTKMVGEYVKPQDWNALISDPNIMVIDVRNTYETRIGMFTRAVDPCTTAFREFTSWIDNQFQFPESDGKSDLVLASNFELNEIQSQESKKLPRVAMYCTGGIRCEKASSYLLSKGFKEVYHLEGGILKYLEEVPKEESLWEGECFVFDKRVSVEHGLVQGTYKLCYACKKPVSDADMEAPEWEYGVSCPFCCSMKSAEEKDRARARQRQFEAWGIIGGPDKGRRKVAMADNKKLLSGSV